MKKSYFLTENLIEFLNLHLFSKKEKKDLDYIAEKIQNYFENNDDSISFTEARLLASEYNGI